MHYGCLVALPGCYDGDIEEAVSKVLAPFDENLELVPEEDDGEAYWTNPRGFWDWWQIGGRWTGYLSDYDPNLDPDNIEVCHLCRGTGTRPDAGRFGDDWIKRMNGCNGCNGTGHCVARPTQWKRHDGDVQRWANVKDLVMSGDKSFYTVVSGEAVAHGERYAPENPPGERFVSTRSEVDELLATIPDDAIVVVVDYHN